MTTKHTPGPWKLGKRAGHRAVYSEEHGAEIAVFMGMLPPDEELANARLIAAAPDMLEALTRAVNFYGDGLDPSDVTEMAIHTAMCAALAKARGEG